MRRLEIGLGDEPLHVAPLVGFEQLCEAGLPDDAAAPDLLRLAEELKVTRVVRAVAEGRLVDADDEVAGRLELDEEEEGGRDVLALAVEAAGVAAAVGEPARPESLPVAVRLPAEEVVIVLADEGGVVVDRVRRAVSRVVVNLHLGRINEKCRPGA